MTPEITMLPQRADGMCVDPDAIEGPLPGYHHNTYVFPLPSPGDGVGPALQGRWKVREPRAGLLWFDRRCFASEEPLLYELQRRIDVIPQVTQVGGVNLQRFVEGSTLGALHPSGTAVPEDVLDQILGVFRRTVPITSGTVGVERVCEKKDHAMEGNSQEFLETLVRFTEEKVYERNLPKYEETFALLGIGSDSFRYLRKVVKGLTSRPFCLLHADLHRENFILDRDGKLWVIDWELAMFGDPLYDLATHLHLMRYPKDQEERLTERWCEAVETVREGSAKGCDADLPRLRAYKKAQSVFTDIVRATQRLGFDDAGVRPDVRLRQESRKVHQALLAAAQTLGLESVPNLGSVKAALQRCVGS
ncbi:aminoglycoside phosphotransferase [Actinobacteria bacterium OK074]|nr:aminoglycoside phosphotransferase [Actinobacteria bacterium OK074]